MKFVTDLPPTRARANHRRYATLLAPVKKRPGQWALVETAETRVRATNIARAIRRSAALNGEFDAASRGTEVYARYIGNGAK